MSTDLPPRRNSSPPPLRQAFFDESPIRALAARTRRWLRLAGTGRILVWLPLAVCAAIVIDLTTSLSPGLRALAGCGVLLGVALLAGLHFWWRPRTVNVAKATQQIEAAHPEFGQLLRTARDPSVAKTSVSPTLKNELFRRAGIHLAGLDLATLLPRRPAVKWLAAGATAMLGFLFFLTVNREAPTAFARLVAPFAGITYTRVENTTPDPTFDRNRLPRVEARVSGRPVSKVTVHVVNPEGPAVSLPMNPLGGGRYEVTLPASESSFVFRIEAGDAKPAEGIKECVDPAVFVSSSAVVELPDYTGQPPTTQDNADIEAVEGTRATLHFKMSGPMAKASLKLPDGTHVPLAVSGTDLSATVEVRVGGEFAELTGTDARGHEIAPTQFKHKGVPDEIPVVEWIEPTKDIDATAVAELPVRLRLRDDFGIASYGVVLQARGESKEIMTRTVEARDLRDLSEMTAAALESFPLTIRDNVRLYAWATDFKPRDKARAVSKLVSVNIKPFKRKWQMLTGPAMQGIPVPPEDLITVEKLIKAQREILSDSFAVIQGPTPPDGTLKEFGDRETKLQQEAAGFHTEVEADGQWPADDIHLLAASVSQMGESADAWFASRPQPGFDRADDALSTLLELRKNLLTLLIKANCPCLEPKPEEVPNKLTDLAAEAERLANEERDVGKQLTATPDAERLEAIRRQQHVANADAGELYARMMDHPETTPLVLSHMADAEQRVREATHTTASNDAVSEAPPQLAAAAEKLDEVAAHLRALDESRLDETLAEMAQDAKKAADAVKPKDDGGKPGEKPEDQAGNKPGEKPGDGNKPAQASGEKGKGESEGKGQGQGLAQGSGQGQGGSNPASNDSEVASNSNPGDGPGASPGSSSRKDAATERKEALAKAARQAATNNDVLKFFADRAPKPEEAARFDTLRKDAKTDELEQKITDVAEGKADGKQTAEELKALAAALEHERALRLQSRLETLAKNREKAAALKMKAQARQDATRKAAPKPADNNSGFSITIPKEVLDQARDAQAPGGKPGPDGKSADGSPGSGPGHGLGFAARELARDIDSLMDPELSRIARELENAPPDFQEVRPLADAERRLADLIAEISGLARGDDSGNNVSPAYRRAVEDYYRALSDDFGDEDVIPR